MEIRINLLASLLLTAMAAQALATNPQHNVSTSDNRALQIFDTGFFRSLKFIYQQCVESDDIYRCSKVQMAKMLGRAYKVPTINIMDGLAIVKKSVKNETQSGRANIAEINSQTAEVDQLSTKSLDALLFERFFSFLHSREVQVNLPRLLVFGEQFGKQFMRYISGYWTNVSEEFEGRGKKKDDKKYLGPFIAAVMLKAAILKMAYHSIAILAGKALIVGKIALIISAIIGLKKLVSSDGGEKTTYEIVKHPQVQQSHTYSSSHAGEYEAGHEGGSYHRSIDDEMMMQDKAYNAWVPTTNKVA